MPLSIIVPAYNDLPAVLRCINTLGDTATLMGNELIVQDDCSPVIDFRGLLPAHANVGRNPRNLGFAGNCNAGALRAHGDLLVFVNQDVYATPGLSVGWDAALAERFASDVQIGIVGGRLLFPDGRIQSCGGLFDMLGNPYHRNLGWSNLAHEDVNTACEVDWTTGALLAIRADVFWRIGGFDEMYIKGYFEDTDACMKVRQLGLKVSYEPRCTLVHTTGTSGGNPAYFMQNAMRFKRQWVDTGKVNRQNAYVAHQRFW